MTPAQQALKDKLAKLKAAGGNSNDKPSTPNASGQAEIKSQERLDDPVCNAPEPKELPVPEKISTSSQAGEGVTPTQQQLTNQETSDRKNAAVTDHPIKMQLAELEQALNDKLPGFKTILRDIHTKIRQDPAIVTLLSDEEIGGILAGLKHHAQVEIIAPKAAKAKKAAGKAMVANMSADDL